MSELQRVWERKWEPDMSTANLIKNFKATNEKKSHPSNRNLKTCTPGSFLISILLRWLRYHGIFVVAGNGWLELFLISFLAFFFPFKIYSILNEWSVWRKKFSISFIIANGFERHSRGTGKAGSCDMVFFFLNFF